MTSWSTARARSPSWITSLGQDLTIQQIAGVVSGVARGCINHGMALAGGETAQMPGLYQVGHFDLAGTIVGIVEEDDALHGDRVRPGDVLLGYESTGLHTNGYTLARRIVFETAKLQLADPLADTGLSVADALLAVHRSYATAVIPVISRLHAIAHITGGGIPGNLVRVLPDQCEALIDERSWNWPPLFRFLQEAGRVSTEEMRDVFNLGIGLIAVVPKDAVSAAQAEARSRGVPTWVLGEIRRGPTGVRFTK